MDFYDFFIALCAKSDIRPSRVVLDCGMSKASVNSWKNKKSLPTDATITTLSNYFNISRLAFYECPDIAMSRGITYESEPPTEEQEKVLMGKTDSNLPQREQMRSEMRILFDAAEDAPTSAILEAAALLMRYKEQSK